MKNTATVRAAPIPTETRPVAHIRIARVVYEDHPVHMTDESDMSIGDIIDARIMEIVRTDGALVSEVNVYFETREQQDKIAFIYRMRS